MLLDTVTTAHQVYHIAKNELGAERAAYQAVGVADASLRGAVVGGWHREVSLLSDRLLERFEDFGQAFTKHGKLPLAHPAEWRERHLVACVAQSLGGALQEHFGKLR